MTSILNFGILSSMNISMNLFSELTHTHTHTHHICDNVAICNDSCNPVGGSCDEPYGCE